MICLLSLVSFYPYLKSGLLHAIVSGHYQICDLLSASVPPSIAAEPGWNFPAKPNVGVKIVQ